MNWTEFLPGGRRFALGLLAILLFLCVIGGGTFRGYTATLLFLRPAAILVVAALVLGVRDWEWHGLRWPLFLLGALALTIVAQLIPLPPAVWQALPGHADYAEAARIAGLAQPWRPISVSPDRTIDSLLSLWIPCAVLLAMAGIPRDQWRHTAFLLVAICAGTALLGILQMMGGQNSPLYYYESSDAGLPIGALANRNHQALLLGATLPLIAIWLTRPSRSLKKIRARQAILLAATFILLILILMTGSRAGLAIAGLAVAAIFLPLAIWAFRAERRDYWIMLVTASPFVMIAIGTALTQYSGFTRMTDTIYNLEAEQRIRALPVMVSITRDFLPWGTGFGTFDLVFQQYEPDNQLHPKYFNHAHNEAVEIAMTGGIPASLVSIAFVIWAVAMGFQAWTGRHGLRGFTLARSGSIIVAMMLLGSLVDYPLRVPLMAAFFSVASAWLGNVKQNLPEGAVAFARQRL